VKRLLHKGLDRDVVDGDDMTAAMLATVCQHSHCATFINTCQSLIAVIKVYVLGSRNFHKNVGFRSYTVVTQIGLSRHRNGSFQLCSAYIHIAAVFRRRPRLGRYITTTIMAVVRGCFYGLSPPHPLTRYYDGKMEE